MFDDDFNGDGRTDWTDRRDKNLYLDDLNRDSGKNGGGGMGCGGAFCILLLILVVLGWILKVIA